MKLTRSCSYRVSYRQDGRKKMTRLDRLEDAVREATNLGNSKRNDQPMYTEIEVWKIEETLVEPEMLKASPGDVRPHDGEINQ